MSESIVSAAIKTGYENLDEMIGGLRKGNVIIIGSRPSMGKTAFVLNLLERISINGRKKCILFSLEDAVNRLTGRLARVISEIDYGDDDNDDKISIAMRKIEDAPVIIDAVGPASTEEINQYIRDHNLQNRLDHVIIDYLQLLSAETSKEEYTQIMREIKYLAMELHVPIVVLSQLNRKVESRPEHKPMLCDFQRLYDPEDIADMVLLLFREEYYKLDSKRSGIMEVIVAKNTYNLGGTVELGYNRACGKIS